MRTLVGTIEKKDGMICLKTQENLWFPLMGNHAIAESFVESFSEPQESDCGKQLWCVNGTLQMENAEQMRERLGQ